MKVPAYTGKSFWEWAQQYIIETCQAVQGNINVQPKHNTIQNVPLGHNRAKSGDTGLDKTPCVPDNAARSLQHDIPEPSPDGVVCCRENGVPSAHPGLVKKPEKLQQNANRLWLWAIATQPVFALAFRDVHPWYALNILFVFTGVIQLLALARTKRLSAILSGLLLLCAMTPLLTPASYGLQGLVVASCALLPVCYLYDIKRISMDIK